MEFPFKGQNRPHRAELGFPVLPSTGRRDNASVRVRKCRIEEASA